MKAEPLNWVHVTIVPRHCCDSNCLNSACQHRNFDTVDYFLIPIMQYVLVGSLHKNNKSVFAHVISKLVFPPKQKKTFA